jgi:hypothetical protein
MRPVSASSAYIRPRQSPAYTSPFATSGDVSLGPMRVRQRTLPKPAENATTSPSIPLRERQGGRLRNVWYTVPCPYEPIAGEAATQRCDLYFQPTPPVRVLIARMIPELLGR